MGWDNWLKKKICLKRSKGGRTKQLEGSNGCNSRNDVILTKNTRLTEDIAARRIQKALRAYNARKRLPRLKGMGRIQGVVDGLAVRNQTLSALNQIHFWSKIQSEIRSRWISMVTEGRIKQKKIENQLKLEAKLHEVEVEWCGGSETMEEILNRIQQREEAAARRERAMAYAFSHQWRANPSQYLGQAYYDLSKDNCGWSWKERWIAVRPWEKRVEASPPARNKGDSKQKTSKAAANLAKTNIIVSVKPALSNGKDATHSSHTGMKQSSPN